MICRFENKKPCISIRTIRTNRTMTLIYKASVLYGCGGHCTDDVRSEVAVCNTEALILLGFVRIVRIVRRFLCSHIYRAYFSAENRVKRPRARKDAHSDRTIRTNRTMALIFKASVLYGWRFHPYKIGCDRTKMEVMA